MNGSVTIYPDDCVLLEKKFVLDRLEIVNCADVCCSEEQESAVAAVAVNVAKIGKEEKKSEGILEGFGELLNTKLINAEIYRM